MPCIACAVIRVESGWMVEHQAMRSGPYHSDELALRVASAEALNMRRKGKRARICMQGRDGEICAEYCLCTEFKP